MKYLFWIGSVLSVGLLAVVALAQPESIPGAATEIYRGVQDKNILMAVGGGIFLLLELAKATVLKGWFQKLPERFRGVPVVILSTAGAIIWKIVHEGGVPADTVYDALFVGGDAMIAHQMIKKMILGK